MEEYLAFIDEIGRSIDGNYTYCFYFTYDKEIVWGDYFNICPCSIVPNIFPDIKTLSHKVNIDFPERLQLAKYNMCFSMQDCIDGIIPMAFVDLYGEKVIFYKENPLFFPFGEDKNIVLEKCNLINVKIGEIEEVIIDDDKNIDSIIDNINNNEDDYNDDDDFDFDDSDF